MTDDDARKIVRACLRELGVDAADPIETQADFAFLRRQRLASERLGMAAKFALIGVLVSGAAGAMWAGLRLAFQQPPLP